MKIYKKKKILIKEISGIKNIAFVPTMGAIHKGHLSLIKKAKKESKNILVTIYVNPKQFNLNSDFKKYPRNIKNDIALLKKAKVKYLYLPSYEDIYLFKTKSHIYLDKFSKTLCGAFRPGHFKGVLNIVNRFIEIIKPSSIFLGFKDFQQLALIKLHIKKNKIAIKIVECPTVRQKNGLALSSRNIGLSKDQIKVTEKVYKYLKNNKKKILSKILKNKKLEILSKIMSLGVKKIDYLKFVNLEVLKEPKKMKEKSNLFIAYYAGNVRLIDNL
jgi:pantoate--beta-alanine ligase